MDKKRNKKISKTEMLFNTAGKAKDILVKTMSKKQNAVTALACMAILLCGAGTYQTLQYSDRQTALAAVNEPNPSISVTTKLDIAPSIIDIANNTASFSAVIIDGDSFVIELPEEGTAQLAISAQYMSPTGENPEITWFSENETIASCENGVITAYQPGEVQIYAQTPDGNIDYCDVTIKRSVTGLWLDSTNIKLSSQTPSAQISYRVFPGDASDQTIIWTSKDTSIATVDSSGVVTATGNGMTEITAQTIDGGFTQSCYVTVSSYTSNIGTINISNKPLAALRPGETFTFKANVSQSSTDNTITWQSSDTNVAVIDANGTVTAIADGTTDITAVSSSGSQDTYTLTVDSNEDAVYTYGSIAVAKPDEDYTPNPQITTKNSSSYSYSYTPSVSGYTQTSVSYSGETVYTQYASTLDGMVSLHMGLSPKPKYNSQAASESIVRQYIDPASFSSGVYKYQFLDLSASNGVSDATMNSFLEGKGILEGMGSYFTSAAKDFGISEVYLAAHSCLETGNGTSRLATGVEYNGVTVYNMYGIGAYDGNAVQAGAKKAYEMGWTTPEKAIYGGAQWISENYIHNSLYRQNTLYKMKWNPANPGVHEYATSVNWAVSQAANIKKIFDMFPEAELRFDIPVYSG